MPEPSQTTEIVPDYFGRVQKRLGKAKGGSQQSFEDVLYFPIPDSHANDFFRVKL